MGFYNALTTKINPFYGRIKNYQKSEKILAKAVALVAE